MELELIKTTIETISELGFIGLLIILAVPSLKKKIFNGNGNSGLMKEMAALKGHFNDETTKHLIDIKEGINKLNNTHKEWEKYGVPVRDCKDE